MRNTKLDVGMKAQPPTTAASLFDPYGLPLQRGTCLVTYPTMRERELYSAEQLECGATLVAIAKDEERYVLEWIAYHLTVGFDRIMLFVNDSSDLTFEVARSASDCDPRIRTFIWPSQPNISPQITAYEKALSLVSTPWVCCLDIDEYLVPFRDGDLKSFLRRAPNCASSIHINWRGFGSGGRQSEDYDLVTTHFIRCSDRLWGNNHHFKTIARTSLVKRCHIHNLETNSGEHVLSNFRPFNMTSNGQSDRIVHDGIQINHYQCKTFAEFERRMARGDANYPPGHQHKVRDASRRRFDQLDRNEYYDFSISTFHNGMVNQIERLSSTPNKPGIRMQPLNELTRIAIKHGTDKYGSHLYTPVYDSLFSSIRHKPLKLLEIGVGGYESPIEGGLSLDAWAEYFPYAQIVGLDISEKRLNHNPRIKIVQGSQTDPEALLHLNATYGPFDIVIDDGSHMPDHVLTSFNILYPIIDPAGFYIVEDTQVSLWRDYGGRPDGVGTIFELAHKVVLENHSLEVEAGGEQDIDHNNLGSITESVHFHRNLIIFKRGCGTFPSNHRFDLSRPQVADVYQHIVQENALNPSSGSYIMRMEMQVCARNKDGAITVANEAIALYPGSPKLLARALRVFEHYGDLEGCRRTTLALAAIYPNDQHVGSLKSKYDVNI